MGAQRKVVSLVMFSHRQLKNVKHLQKQAIFVTGVVLDTHLVLTHADAFTELLTRIFTSTRTKLAQRTGGQEDCLRTKKLNVTSYLMLQTWRSRMYVSLFSTDFNHDNVESAEC